MADPPPPDLETLRVSVAGAVGSLTLHRPDRLNAMSPRLLSELAAAARWFDGHDGVKVVVVAGSGRAFCAGFDVGRAPDAGDAGHPAVLGRAMAEAVAAMRAVTVASIQGHCIGGGVVLACACDLRVAAADARFRIPEVDLGVPLFWTGIPRLARLVGPAMTKELVMTGRPFDAAEAKAIGLVNRVVSGDLGSATADLVAGLAAKPAVVLETTKRQVDGGIFDDEATDVALFDAVAADPEARAAAARYLASLRHD